VTLQRILQERELRARQKKRAKKRKGNQRVEENENKDNVIEEEMKGKKTEE